MSTGTYCYCGRAIQRDDDGGWTHTFSLGNRCYRIDVDRANAILVATPEPSGLRAENDALWDRLYPSPDQQDAPTTKATP
jgi:hypothetical protein